MLNLDIFHLTNFKMAKWKATAYILTLTWLQLQVVCVVAVAGVSSGQEEDSKVAESSHSAGYSVIHSLPPAPTPAFTHHQVTLKQL